MNPSTSTSSLEGLQIAGSGALSWLLLALLLVGAGWLALRAYRDTEPALTGPARGLLSLLRFVVLALLVIMLAEPVLHRRHTVTRQPSVLLLLDDSASMAVPVAGGGTRWDRATELAGQLRREFGDRGGLAVWQGQGARRLTRSDRVGETLPDPALRNAEGTDLPALLISAAQRQLDENLQGIFLFSDGVTTTANPPSLAGLDVPVYTVAVGDSVGPADLRLDHVRHPTLVHRGDLVEIQGEAVARGAERCTVLLQRGGAVLDSLQLEMPGGGRRAFTFTVEADSLGLATYQLRLRPAAGEALRENNEIIVGMEVRKEKLRILQLSQRPDWNAHFLARAAAHDARFSHQVVHRAESGWRIAGTDSLWTPPASPEDCADVDLWVLSTHEDLNFLLERSDALKGSLRAGAGLLLLGGEPGRIRPSLPSPLAAEFLPMRAGPGLRWRLARHEVDLSAAGRSHPVLALPPELGALEDRLAALPPLWGLLEPMQARDDADLLLEATDATVRLPLLAVRDFGAGRVAQFSAGPLWSWSFWRLSQEESEDFFDALIGNLLYYLAEGGERERLRLMLPRPVLAEGEDVALRAIALDQRLLPDLGEDIWLEWRADGEEVKPAQGAQAEGRARMALDPRTPGGRILPMPALPAGRYRLRLALEEGDDRIESEWSPLVIDPHSVEVRDPRVDFAALSQLAQRGGGRLLNASDLRSFASTLPLEQKEILLAGRIDLWNSMWLFVPLLVLLALEWVLRKRYGLI